MYQVAERDALDYVCCSPTRRRSCRCIPATSWPPVRHRVGPIQAGDHVVMELGGIGRLAVDIVAAPPGAPLAEIGLGNPKV